MNPPLLSPESLRAVTRERLRLLAMFYYISGIITFVMASFLVLLAGTWIAISFVPASEWEKQMWKADVPAAQHQAATEAEVAAAQPKFEPPVVMFRIFAGLALLLMLGGWTFAGFSIYAGRCISKRKKKTLVMIMAALHCLLIPFGTLLGIFTLIGLGTTAAKEEWRLAELDR